MENNKILLMLEEVKIQLENNDPIGICQIVENFYYELRTEEWYDIKNYIRDKLPPPNWDVTTFMNKNGFGMGFVWEPYKKRPRIEFIQSLIDEFKN